VVGILDIGRHVHAMAGISKAAHHHVAQNGVVFDKQNSHGL